MGSNPRNVFATVSPHLSALVYWHSGVSLPVVRPLGLYTNVVYRPRLSDIMVTKHYFVMWDLVCIGNQFLASLVTAEGDASIPPRSRTYNSTSFVHMKHLTDKSWRNWAQHRAAVFLPYDPQQLTFYELYGMGVPLLVPSEELVPLFTRLG